MTKSHRWGCLAMAAAAVLCAGPLWAQQAPADAAGQAAELAKKLTNPVADLASIPFQFNWQNGVGTNDDLRMVLNVQPVVPVSVSENWNLIGRFILPIVSQPQLTPGGETAFGTGDIVLSAFLSPKKGGVTWGVGPVFGLPTTTNPLLGSGKWSIGPTAVVLKMQGPWTYGALVNHLWSFADTGDVEREDVNQSFLQPFLAYTTKQAVTFVVNSEATANWEAESGQEWTVPINLLASKLTRLGPFPLSVQGGLGVYVESPDSGPDWQLRMAFTVLLPKGK